MSLERLALRAAARLPSMQLMFILLLVLEVRPWGGGQGTNTGRAWPGQGGRWPGVLLGLLLDLWPPGAGAGSGRALHICYCWHMPPAA